MYQEIERFKAKTHKPVVASCQEVAASGAFYVSCASDWIMAQPTSVVGSIGVIFNTFNFTGTMAKIGATSDAIKSGPLKDMGSPF
jgi:protease-4